MVTNKPDQKEVFANIAAVCVKPDGATDLDMFIPTIHGIFAYYMVNVTLGEMKPQKIINSLCNSHFHIAVYSG